MAKKRRKNQKPKKVSTENMEKSVLSNIFSLKSFWGLIAGIGVITGLWMFFWPKVTVTSLSPLNPSEALSAPFIISNDGYLAIGEVRVACTINKIVTAQKVTYLPAEKKREAARFVDLTEAAAIILPGEKYTVECPITRILNFNSPVDLADITVVVSYKMKPIPITRKDFYRFQSKRNSKGEFVWVPQPVDK
jgi:hypothetical protein